MPPNPKPNLNAQAANPQSDNPQSDNPQSANPQVSNPQNQRQEQQPRYSRLQDSPSSGPQRSNEASASSSQEHRCKCPASSTPGSGHESSCRLHTMNRLYGMQFWL